MAMLMLTLMLTLMLRPILTLMLMPMSHIRLKVGGAPGPPLTEVRPHNRPNCCGQPLLTNYCGIFLGKQEIPYKQIREMLSAVGPVRRLFEAASQKCRDQSQWNGHWWFMSSTVFTTIWRKFVELNPNILTSYWSKTGNCEKSEILDYQSICFCNLEGFTKDAVAASNMPQNIKFTRCSSKEIQSQTSNLQAAHKIESQIYVSTHNSREWFSRIWLFQIWQTRGRLNDEFKNLTIS